MGAAAALATAAPAMAGTPFVITGVENSRPTVTAGPAGVFHVVYDDPATDSVVYCQILAGKRGCAKGASLPFSLQPGIDNPGTPWIVRDEDSGTLHIVAAEYVGARTLVRTSTDNGSTWGPLVQIHGPLPPALGNSHGTEISRPVQFPAANSVGIVSANPGVKAYEAPLDGSRAGSDAYGSLNYGTVSSLGYSLDVSYDSEGTILTNDNLDNVYYWRQPNGNDLENGAAWGEPVFVAAGSGASMHGRGTPWLGYTRRQSGKDQLVMRAWNGNGFGPAKVVQNVPGYMADVYVSDGGTPGVVYRQNGVGLRYAELRGGKFVPKTIVRNDSLFSNVSMAHDDQGRGIAVWHERGAVRAADLTEVRDPNVPRSVVNRTVKGKTIGLAVEGSCVMPGAKTVLGVSGQGKGKIVRVTFRLGAQKPVTDTTAPFSAKFTIPKKAKPGTAFAATSVTLVQPSKGAAFTVKNQTTVRVCGG